METPRGKFIWNELMTHDPEKAKKFGADTFGWTYDAMKDADGGTYWVCKAQGEGIGGIFEMKDPALKAANEIWVPYVAVDDVDAAYKQALAGGANSCRAPFDIPDVGRIAMVFQPGGAMIAVIKPMPRT